MLRLVDDGGHGGRDPGAVGPKGVFEKTITLSVAKLLGGYMAGNADVRYTRTTDIALGSTTNDDLAARVGVANSWPADLFVSIHCNSGSAQAQGMEIYTTRGQNKSDPIAEAIVQAWSQALPGGAIRKDLTDGDSDKEANYYVLYYTKMPAVLIELAFISNPTEEQLLTTQEFQHSAALAIARGICSAYGLGFAGATIQAGAKLVAGSIMDGSLWGPMAEVCQAKGIFYAWDPIKYVMALGDAQSANIPATTGVTIAAGKAITGKLINNVTWAPMAAVCKALGISYTWDAPTRTMKL